MTFSGSVIKTNCGPFATRSPAAHARLRPSALAGAAAFERDNVVGHDRVGGHGLIEPKIRS